MSEDLRDLDRHFIDTGDPFMEISMDKNTPTWDDLIPGVERIVMALRQGRVQALEIKVLFNDHNVDEDGSKGTAVLMTQPSVEQVKLVQEVIGERLVREGPDNRIQWVRVAKKDIHAAMRLLALEHMDITLREELHKRKMRTVTSKRDKFANILSSLAWQKPEHRELILDKLELEYQRAKDLELKLDMANNASEGENTDGSPRVHIVGPLNLERMLGEILGMHKKDDEDENGKNEVDDD